MVRRGFAAAWFLAASPTNRSSSVKATYDGVIRCPWSFARISTLPFCITPTQEYVVPRSIPITIQIFVRSCICPRGECSQAYLFHNSLVMGLATRKRLLSVEKRGEKEVKQSMLQRTSLGRTKSGFLAPSCICLDVCDYEEMCRKGIGVVEVS
jgi:hypothetical protein